MSRPVRPVDVTGSFEVPICVWETGARIRALPTGLMSEVESYYGMFSAAISFDSTAVLSEYGSISGDGIYEHILAYALRAFNYFLYGVPHIQFIEVLLGFR